MTTGVKVFYHPEELASPEAFEADVANLMQAYSMVYVGSGEGDTVLGKGKILSYDRQENT
jgi:hypothetical protein